MPVSQTTTRFSAAGDGVTTVLAFPHVFYSTSDIVVLEVDDTTGAETTLAINTNYTVSGTGSPSGGSITRLVAAAVGKTTVAFLKPALTQTLSLTANQAVNLTELSKRLDILTNQVQYVESLATRSARLPDGRTAAFDPKLPATLSANKALAVNGSGNGWVLADLSVDAVSLGVLTGGAASDASSLHMHSADRARANHTGTQTASTISDFNTAVGAIAQPLDAELTAIAGLTSAADKIIRFTGSGAAEVITCTNAGRDLLDDANAAAMLTTLGAAPSSRTINTSGGITGGGDLSANRTLTIADGALTPAKIGTAGGDVILGRASTAGNGQELTFNSSFGISTGEFVIKTGGLFAGAFFVDNTISPSRLAFSATTKLAGRSTAGAGAGEEISIGAGLSLSGGTLSATGGSATITVKSDNVSLGGGTFNTVDFSSHFAASESPAQEANISISVLPDTITNITAATDLTLTPTGSNVVVTSGKTLKASAITTSTDANLVLTAGATNRSVVLTPTGTGKASVATGKTFEADTIQAATTNGDVTIQPNGTGTLVKIPNGKSLECNTYQSLSGSDLSLNASGTNQNVNLTPVGTGRARVTDTFGTYLLPGCVFANTSDIGSVSDNTAVSSFGSIYTFPANSIAAGRVIIIRGDLTYTAGTNANQTLLLDCRFGSVTVHDFGSDVFIAVANAASNIGVSFEIRLNVRASGAGGTLMNGGFLIIGREGSTIQDRGAFKCVVGTAATSVDWTAAQAVTLRGGFGINTGSSESMTLRNVSIFVQ